MEKIKDLKFYISLIGFLLIIFSSLYIFTRPAIWVGFDFSETGNIGDTIGGITAPMINLFGAYLLYISLKEQIIANKKIYDTTLDQRIDRNFDIVLKTFLELKSDFLNLEYKNCKSTAALNVFINNFNETWSEVEFWQHLGQPIYSECMFIITQYDFIIFQLNNGNIREKEKSILKAMIINYYISRFENPLNVIKKQLIKFNARPDHQYLINNIIKFNSENNFANNGLTKAGL
jgi:hypothetical protein